MRRLSLSIFLCLLSFFVVAQNVKVDFTDGEFFLAEEDYEEALYAFGKVINNGYEDNAYINYRMGMCLININGRKTEAIPYLEKAVQQIAPTIKEGKLGEVNAPPDAHLYLGNAYRINMEISKATDQYEAFNEYIDPRDKILQAYVDQQIESCGNLLAATSNPVEYKQGNLGQLPESHATRYNMVVSNDMQTMAFMGKNPFYSGIYVAVKNGDVWEKPLNITPSVASDGNMDVVALSSDGKKMLLAVMDEFSSNLYMSVYENNRWNPAVSFGKPINSRYYEASAALSPDGNSLYFSSNRKGSIGGMDIFRSDLQEDGMWSEPVNLGPGINTVLNEDTPYLSPDGKKIYFSSQGHSTIGGFDVFYSELSGDGNWSETPVNLGYPLNTSDDDMAVSPLGIAEEDRAFVYAFNKVSGYDVFKFEMIDRDATPVAVPFDEVKEEEALAESETEVEVEVPVVTEPVAPPPPEQYYLRPIYFDFESYILTAEGMKKMDQLTTLMEKYSSMKIEITGHTDALGTLEYNQRLSVNRANAAYKYLILNGISQDRLEMIGMSERMPVARNTTSDNRDAPDGRMLNRRVEFDITLNENVIIEMEKVNIPDHLKLEE
jgi:outer membrane protein OmpA-like peptidoglycan-associated protein/tetratricopeptide (TPR) repeat protein